jgi:hypothetical protein
VHPMLSLEELINTCNTCNLPIQTQLVRCTVCNQPNHEECAIYEQDEYMCPNCKFETMQRDLYMLFYPSLYTIYKYNCFFLPYFQLLLFLLSSVSDIYSAPNVVLGRTNKHM